MVVDPDTELVIDGYTRSATTYAVYAFQAAQPEPVRVAHHLHAPAQIVAAARWAIPTILLVRDPKGAVLSQIVREPGVTARDALVSWRRFYEVALRFSDAFVIGEFNEVTNQVGSVIERVNQRFSTSFVPYERTEENERHVLALMAERPTTIPEWSALLLGFESGLVSSDELLAGRDRFGGRADRGARATWVPSEEREAAKERSLGEWESPSLDRERERAYGVFARVLGS
jgi:hypothetical protein